ncbi:hypothetical protein [Rubinisphaera sp.]|uniref:hypothetical protein n=1 Tax=Rubinisphaera sp. TaxID=2024857 RepID=UPI000C0DD998|nr:hypothetical protein [Rubinisphaera sp.]MBV10431.1 hypothetical protein [Rubinisphaera sp.]HCS55387.1 hypothetical protein [Planctomycetaceae bacterium]|tara:strand:- start:488 stop:751 length:264 start_codon:yes stop_codon:yes gene_type:complete
MMKKKSETARTTRKNKRAKLRSGQSKQIDREEQLPFLAMKALDKATQQAMNSGSPMVFSRNGKLYLRTADGEEKFIKTIRKPVTSQD